MKRILTPAAPIHPRKGFTDGLGLDHRSFRVEPFRISRKDVGKSAARPKDGAPDRTAHRENVRK